jgi:hypothetical protein
MDHDEPPKRDRECYTGERTVAFNAVTLSGAEVFTRPEVVLPHVEYLIRAAGRFHCVMPIYCFLPSQFHAVFRGTQPDAQLLDAMNYFKHLSGMWLRMHALPGWERGYRDQVLDSEGAWRAHAAEIAYCPVMAGLARDWHEYPFTGSLGFDLREIVA